ncbi:hypothetical protein AB0368_03775 [Actinoplanes sp. NPDC051475]|uniref:hypothetical protein n=1 Tax=Actinoplanes sp. NPDC051475 TaxID=3157225 RepID=UPI00344D014C
MVNVWTRNDAWVLGALGGTGADSAASLSEVIARSDALEHQMIEEAEFAGSAGRLIAAGLVLPGGEFDRAADAYAASAQRAIDDILR